ncbi:MMPL family transporter [Halioxenophilus aromaticivorans]|uniref:MMPL family transporter n=1 Tax=Halioxenophilus aromaticivorans TaxID=1306992 RepID=A0AAV3TZI6_9ALTE
MVNLRSIAATLLLAVILFSVGFYLVRGVSGQPWQIDTDLRSLVPSTPQQQVVAKSVDYLLADLQQNILFLITLPVGQDAESAGLALTQALADIPTLAVTNEQQLKTQLTNLITRNRFYLLTPEQRAMLEPGSSAKAIAQQAVQERYALSATPQIIPFEIDPLGWYSQQWFGLLAGLQSNQALPDHIYSVSAQLTTTTFGMQGQAELLQSIEAAEKSVKALYPNSSIQHSGVFFYAAAAAEESKRDITRISIISGVTVIVLLFIVFRAFSSVIFPLLSIALGVAFAFACVHIVFGGVHILTVVFGASLIGIVVDYSIHSFFHLSGGGETRSLHRALLLSLVTSLVGYAALGLSHLPALSQVAVFSCAGMIAAWLLVVVLAPGFGRQLQLNTGALARLQQWINKPVLWGKPGWLSVVAVVCVLAGLTLSLLQPSNASPFGFFKPNPAVLAMDQAVAKQIQGFEPATFVVITGRDENSVYEQSQLFFEQVAKSEQLSVDDFFSVTQWRPSSRQQRSDYRSQQALYQPGGVVEHYYQLLGVGPGVALAEMQTAYREADGQQTDTSQWLSFFGTSVPALWQKTDQGLLNIILIKQGVDLSALQGLLAGSGRISLFRSIEQTQQMLTTQKNSASLMLLLAYGCVGLFLLGYFRRFSALAIVLIPMCGTGLMVVVFSLFSVPLNLFHTMAAFLVLGLGLDYGIFAYQMRGHQRVTEQAVIISAATSLLSFGLLAFSQVPVVNSFGWALLIANTINLLGAIVLGRHLPMAVEVRAAH